MIIPSDLALPTCMRNPCQGKRYRGRVATTTTTTTTKGAGADADDAPNDDDGRRRRRTTPTMTCWPRGPLRDVVSNASGKK